MKKNNRKFKPGDTIIEVLLAVAIFSAIAVASLTTMNRGITNVQTALEETLVRSEIDAQSDLIRYIRDGYISTPNDIIGSNNKTYENIWDNMIDKAKNGSTTINTTCSNNTSLQGFILSSDNNGGLVKYRNVENYASYGGIPKASAGNISSSQINNDIWVTVVKSSKEDNSSPAHPSYYDFYINTCWYSPGSSVGTTLYTVIRLTNPDYTI